MWNIIVVVCNFTFTIFFRRFNKKKSNRTESSPVTFSNCKRRFTSNRYTKNVQRSIHWEQLRGHMLITRSDVRLKSLESKKLRFRNNFSVILRVWRNIRWIVTLFMSLKWSQVTNEFLRNHFWRVGTICIIRTMNLHIDLRPSGLTFFTKRNFAWKNLLTGILRYKELGLNFQKSASELDLNGMKLRRTFLY